MGNKGGFFKKTVATGGIIASIVGTTSHKSVQQPISSFGRNYSTVSRNAERDRNSRAARNGTKDKGNRGRWTSGRP